MAKLLVHIHSHPEMKNNVTMGLLVAVTGLKEGYDVEGIFMKNLQVLLIMNRYPFLLLEIKINMT